MIPKSVEISPTDKQAVLQWIPAECLPIQFNPDSIYPETVIRSPNLEAQSLTLPPHTSDDIHSPRLFAHASDHVAINQDSYNPIPFLVLIKFARATHRDPENLMLTSLL